MNTNVILNGDALAKLKELPSEFINCVMTSPPYWALRDYGVNGQLGLEPTFDLYIKHLCDIFDEVKRVLRKDGTCWVNLGDTYYGGGNNRGNTKTLSDIQKGNRGAVGQVQQKWIRPSRIAYNEKHIIKKCLLCNKEFQSNTPNSQFCSKECLNKMGNDFRSQNRILPDKSLCMIPFRFAIEMVNRGWILRNTIIWHKPNCMPSSVKDRFTVDFEYLFFFTKSKKYWFETQYEKSVDKESYIGRKRRRVNTMAKFDIKNYQSAGRIQEDGWLKGEGKTYPERNKRAVWSICPRPFKEAHFATYPEQLCEIPIKSGCPINGVVMDPFFGAGTTGLVALKQGKKFIGIELNPEYIKIAEKRLKPFLQQSTLSQQSDTAVNTGTYYEADNHNRHTQGGVVQACENETSRGSNPLPIQIKQEVLNL